MVKRETGESPVRSRHCKPGVQNRCIAQPLRISGRSFCMQIGKSGNLPIVGTGSRFQITSNWSYRIVACNRRRGRFLSSVAGSFAPSKIVFLTVFFLYA